MAGSEAIKKVVLLSCGSFNPITYMHLRMFELARDALHRIGNYSVVEGIISPVNDDYAKLTTKKLEKSSHRIGMVGLAAQTSDWIHVDDWEAKQSNWVRTIEVLKHTEESIGSRYSGTVPKLKLLCGGDLLESFAVPGLWEDKDIQAIVEDYGLVVITRSGSDPDKFIYESDVLTKYKNNIIIVKEWMFNDISSTKVRRALKRNESVHYIIPDAVLKYIQKQGLYQE